MDHLLRLIDRFVDLSGVREQLQPLYSSIGRPAVDPELMIPLLIVGYCFGIRSERGLCDEVHLNLGYRWFCRLSLDAAVPDHSTFSKARHGRFRHADLLRQVFETVVRRCMAQGLVGGEGFAVDASLITANAHRQHGGANPSELKPEASRAVAEYLAMLDNSAFGAATDVGPKFTSPHRSRRTLDGCQQRTCGIGLRRHYLIDLKCAVILDIEPTTAVRQAEVTAAKTMIVRTAERFDLEPGRLVADAGYGSAEMLSWLVEERGIEPHIPVFDKSARTDGSLSRADFTYDHTGDAQICPRGKLLTTRGTLVNDGATLIYRASKFDCSTCDLKPRCYATRPRARCRAVSTRARGIWRARDPLRLRGHCGVRDEFLLAATAQNLRKLAKLIPLPQPATS